MLVIHHGIGLRHRVWPNGLHHDFLARFAIDDGVGVCFLLAFHSGNVSVFSHYFHPHRVAIEVWVSKQISYVAEIKDGEVEFVEILINARAASNNLLELRHALDVAVEHNHLAGLGIHPRGHQFGGNGYDRVFFFGTNEIIKFVFAFIVVARNAHHILATGGHQVGILVYQGLAHAFGMFNIYAEHNGFVHAAGAAQKLGHLFGHQFPALVHHNVLIKIFFVINAVFHQAAELIGKPFRRAPPVYINIQIDAHHTIGRQKAVINALPQGVRVHRITKVFCIRYIRGFLGCCRHADVCGRRKVIENSPPGGIIGCAAAVALVYHHQIKKIGTEIFVRIFNAIGIGEALVQAQKDFIRFVAAVNTALFAGNETLITIHIHHLFLNDGHLVAEVFEVAPAGLVDQRSAIGQEKDSFFHTRLPQPVDDLKSRVRFACAGGHDQQDAVIAFGDGFHRAVDGDLLIVSWRATGAIRKVFLRGNPVFVCRGEALEHFIAQP